MSNQNWRTEVNAGDYFGHQQKKLQIADRRPLIRKAADLVGPGVASNAVQITNFNDLLATYNGFFSADAGAANAPNDTDEFVGFVSSDIDLGGVQQFSSLVDSSVWQRTFTRSPLDQSAIFWGAWEYGAGLSARVDFLEGLTAALDGRVTELEQAATPLYTGIEFFFMTGIVPGGTAAGTIPFGVTFPVLPACWAIRAGFVSGSSLAVVSMVDEVTTSDCRVTVTNVGTANATFVDLPVRWFAQAPIN